MRELIVFEIENVSGVGWLQDGLVVLGSKVGVVVWMMGIDVLSINLLLFGIFNLVDLVLDLGKILGESVGLIIGGIIESVLVGLLVIGGLLNKLFGN